jgi:hypothetical protein
MMTGTRLALVALLLAGVMAGCASEPKPTEKQKSNSSKIQGGVGQNLQDLHEFVPGPPAQIDITPANGARFSGRAQVDDITFSGFTTAAGQTVEVQVLNDPNAAIAEENWVTLATTTSESTPTQFNDPAPIFRWTVEAAPGADGNKWPDGGVLRYRAIVTDSAGAKTLLPFFDDTSGRCVAGLGAASWKDVITKCKSPFSPDFGAKLGSTKRAAALVSTSPEPRDQLIAPPYLTKKGAIFDFQTDAYYFAVGAPQTLQEFQLRYDFLLEGDDASGIYYNKGDLGIGREMHCKTFDNAFGKGTACYVTNYGTDIDNKPDFSGDADSAMDDATSLNNHFATVCTVKFGDQYAPAEGNDVQFFVYNAQDEISNLAQLDSIGVDEAIPNNCLNCHGGTFDASTLNLVGSSFLPFDPDAFLFSKDPGFSYEEQQEEIRKLNVIAKNAGGPPGTVQFVDGTYNGKAEVPGTKANLNWTPKGWSGDFEAQTVYRELYKPYCRTCHISQIGDFAFERYEDFKNEAAKSADDVCETTQMPIAEATLHQFWNSPGRAYIVNALEISSSCNGGGQ